MCVCACVGYTGYVCFTVISCSINLNSSYTGDVTNKSRSVLPGNTGITQFVLEGIVHIFFSFSAVPTVLYLDGVSTEVSLLEVLTCLLKVLHRPAVRCLMQMLSSTAQLPLCLDHNTELIKKKKARYFAEF